jgi:hypothetical protein
MVRRGKKGEKEKGKHKRYKNKQTKSTEMQTNKTHLKCVNDCVSIYRTLKRKGVSEHKSKSNQLNQIAVKISKYDDVCTKVVRRCQI